VPLISKPYCKLANDIRINENNSIFYKVMLYNNSFQIEDVNSLKEKIDVILNNEKNYEEISSAWSKEMMLKNTLTKRAEYIINIIKKNLNDYK
jgi:glycosyltransferase involved in cell wall biosynthesis